MTTIRLRTACAVACALVGALADASPFTPPVDFAFGSGEHEVYLAIDWRDASYPNALVWSFSYESETLSTVYDLMLALEAADGGLSFGFNTDWGAPFLEEAVYDGSPLDLNRNTATSGASDYWSFWEYDVDTSWGFAGAGVSDTPLVPGSLYGFNYEPDWNDPSSPPGMIPEPGVFTLVLLGIGVLSWRRTRR